MKNKEKKSLYNVVKREWEKDKIVCLFYCIALFIIALFLIQFTIDTFFAEEIYFINNALFHKNFTDTFADFNSINFFFQKFSPYLDPYDASYPPLNFVFATPFMLLARIGMDDPTKRLLDAPLGETISVFAWFFLWAVLIAVLIYQTKKKFNFTGKQTTLISIVCLISTPFLYLFERGNYLFLTFFFTCMFLLWYNEDSKVKREFSYLFLACAVGMKLYPAIFGLLLLKEKRILDLVKSATYSIALLILPFFIMKGGFVNNVTAFYNNLVEFSSWTQLTVNVSTTNFFRITVYLFGGDQNNEGLLKFATYFKLTLMAISAVSALLTKKKWQTITICALAVIIVPHPAMVYSLMFMLIAIVCFLNDKERTKMDYFYMALFLLIIMPLQFGYIIDYMPRLQQFEGIHLVHVNYLGLSTNVYLESIACFVLAITLNVEIFVRFFKDRKNLPKNSSKTQ